MISAWWLLLIVPVSLIIGVVGFVWFFNRLMTRDGFWLKGFW